MTQDFRQPGPASMQSADAEPPARRIVAMSLYASAAVFFAAGLWLLLAEQNFLPAAIAPVLGGALLFAALSDLAVMGILKRFWARKASRGT